MAGALDSGARHGLGFLAENSQRRERMDRGAVLSPLAQLTTDYNSGLSNRQGKMC